MDLVRFDAQERVDLPDMTAVSFLVLGEFRRTVRALLQGEEAAYIVRGFEVVPESPASTRVEVNLTNGADPNSLALLPENTGSLDYGQLTGDVGSDGNPEGNAQQLLDFSGQPAGSYTVEMRFVPYTSSTGANDNRAFWNRATDSEFLAATDTRYKAAWQAQYVLGAPSGGEWLALATVVWDGATVVDAADITDLRDFVFEGTAGAFDAASQAGPGGMDDFDRTATRGDITVGINEVYPALRALARQVQDLKGQDTSGNFNWYARVYRPFDDSNSTLPATQTKSLRTVDTVTYTIGDGTTTFGDFNGANGLEDCLQHLEDLGNQRPGSVEIVLKTHATPFFAFDITSSHDFRTDDIRLRIRSQGPGAVIDASTIPASQYAILGSTQSLVEFENLTFLPMVNNAGLVALGDGLTPASGGTFQARGCSFLGDTSASALPVITASYERFVMEHCSVQGVVEITGYNNTQGLSDESGGVIRGCTFQEGGIRGLVSTSGGDSWAVQMLVENCEFETTVASRLGLNGVLDLGAPVGWTIRDCRIAYQGDMDGIHIRYDIASGTKAAQHVKIDNCTISQATTGTHAVDSGTNGTDGTGWGIYIDGVSGGGRAGDISIVDCRYFGANLIDGGGLFMNSPLGVQVRGCQWAFCAHDSGAGSRFSAVYITAASGDTEVNVKMTDCVVRDWATTTANRVQNSRAIYLNNVADVDIVGCNIDGGSFGTPISGRNATYAALYLDGGCEDIKVLGCTFENWETDTGTNSRCIVSGTGVMEKFIISNNRFRENGGFCIDFNAASTFSASSMVGNVMMNNYQGIDVRATILVTQVVISQNTIFDGGAAATEGIAWPLGTSGTCTCTGNTSNQNIRGDSNIHGYNAASEDLNNVNAYV